ncbi:hypothetical protein KSMBR1_0894 [Candidatus Kuenenia stuttgartiensis]|uniref:Uncharacterized protein n=3 Tax=Candidatus Kuenenia TaxID=380738 RepID=A0A2C9CCN0_KUEST|nr:hypothetical protein KSMBR1_0894 [Candidatus Kuenenia stuttgartiensis]
MLNNERIARKIDVRLAKVIGNLGSGKSETHNHGWGYSIFNSENHVSISIHLFGIAMFKKPTNYHQSANPGPSRLDLFGLRQTTWLAMVFFVGVSLILARRTLYTAPDDLSYIKYFEGTNFTILTDWWSYVLEEPLWSTYASFMGEIFGAETSLRITIFFSSLMFLVANNKLTRGAWIFILFAFVIDSTLSTQMYYNQIRQGFALSVFLMMVAGGLSPFLGAVVASTIHTSFIFVIPCAIAAVVARRSNIRLIAILLAVGLYVFYLNRIMGSIDFGRRSESYELKGKVNVFFYAATVLQNGLIFFLLKNKSSDDQQEFWFRFSLIFCTFAICMTLIHAAAGRLMYIANALVAILLGLNLKRERGKITAIVWFLLLFALLINEGRKGGFGSDTWFGRWYLILR